MKCFVLFSRNLVIYHSYYEKDPGQRFPGNTQDPRDTMWTLNAVNGLSIVTAASQQRKHRKLRL